MLRFTSSLKVLLSVLACAFASTSESLSGRVVKAVEVQRLPADIYELYVALQHLFIF